MHVEPFRIHVPDATLADLRERLARTRFPDEIAGGGWTYGTNLSYLRELVAYWRDRYDWRAAEARLNDLPQFRADVDGLGIHFIHARGVGPAPFPLVITHGWPGSVAEFVKEETGYQRIQGTKPQTLGYALSDSPAGLAAWIVEKFRTWSDCDGEVERRFTRDELLTNVTIYWVTETIASSMRLYYEMIHAEKFPPRDVRVDVPTGCAIFPREILKPPRAWAERLYEVRRWTRMPRGGHFAAMEEPGLLVEDVRAFFRPLR